jgi:DNA/RNA-binding domain of Phe-tRNA-synthetase-like protein
MAAMSAGDPALDEGWIERELATELPDLRLASVTVPGGPRRSPPELRARLGMLADRFHGARALSIRREAVPAAYRVLFRHLGLDPDVHRTPIEAAAVQRLLRGGFASGGAVEDACLLALVETGVPVWALDAARVDGPLGLRAARPGERLGDGAYADDLAPGRIVVADGAGPVAVLFGETAAGRLPRRETTRLLLFAVGAPGVPALYFEEALYCCAEALDEA